MSWGSTCKKCETPEESLLRSFGLLAMLGVAVAATLFSSPASAAPAIPSIQVSRSSGVAPLAVHFDATSTTDGSFPRPFHALRYEWSFGDPESGSWSVSGQSKNQALGPLAGHLFERPGSYAVSLTVTNPAGEETTRTTSIRVTDPNTVFSAQNTFCYADHGDRPENWSGCPVACPGPNCINTSNANPAIASRIAPNTRHLLRRGDAFAQSSTLMGSTGPVQIAAFGPETAPRPVLQSDFAEHTMPAIAGQSDWSVGELSLQGADGVALSASGSVVERLSVWDVEARGFSQCAVFWGSGPFHRNLAVVDFRCSEVQPSAAEGSWIFFERSEGSMYMGIEIDGANATTSNGLFRTVHMFKSVIQHSRFDVGGSGGAVSLRTCGSNCPSSGLRNRFIVFSDNRITSGIAIPIRTCTHNVCKDSGTDGNQFVDVLWERNFLAVDGTGPNNMNMIFWLQGGDQTLRNNVFDLTGAPPDSNIHLVVSQFGPSENGLSNRDNLHVFNNTVFANGSLRGITLCSIAEQGTGHRCRNNLLFAPGASQKVGSAPQWLASNNLRDGLEYTGFPYATPYRGQNRSLIGDFRLAANAAPIDAGFDFTNPAEGHVADDAFLGCRLSGSHWDVGAHESGSVPCGAGVDEAPLAPVLLP